MKQISMFLLIVLLGTLKSFGQKHDLQIGDQIPEAVWHTSLKIAGQNTQDNWITLNDYRGKLIVLDFWSTWCSSCIRNMPYLHALENEFQNDFVVVPVTKEDAGKIGRFLSTNVTLKPLNIFSVVEDSILYATFPSSTLPHLALIDQEGILRAITNGEYIDRKVLNGLINNKSDIYIPNKKKGLQTALMSISPVYNDAIVNEPLYYSTVTGFLDGASQTMNREVDSVKGSIRYSVINTYINNLYTVSVPSSKGGLPLYPKRSIYELNNPDQIGFTLDNYWNIDNRRATLFCYEMIYPLSLSESEMKAKMKLDLDFFFGMNGRIEEREIECLVLRNIGHSQGYLAKGGEQTRVYEGKISNRDVDKIKHVGALSNGVDTYIRNLNFSDVEGMIDRICDKPVPVILNETGHDGLFDVDFPSPGSTLEEINNKLKEQGLELVPAKRKMDMFVLTENGFDAKGEELVFSEYGYVYPSTLK